MQILQITLVFDLTVNERLFLWMHFLMVLEQVTVDKQWTNVFMTVVRAYIIIFLFLLIKLRQLQFDSVFYGLFVPWANSADRNKKLTSKLSFNNQSLATF